MNFDLKHNDFFAVELPDWLGLGDKLWHLSKLYRLGRSMSYSYVHTPFNCARSSSSSYVAVDLLRLLRRITSLTSSQKYASDYIGKFLGLERRTVNINDPVLKTYKRTTVCLDNLFQDKKFNSLDEIKAVIDSVNSDGATIKILTTHQGIYSYVDRLDELLAEACGEKDFLEELEIAKHYWFLRSRKSIDCGFSPSKIKVLVHIRNGDTTTFRIGRKMLSIFASYGRIVETEDDIFDSSRQPILLQSFSDILEEIFQMYGEDKFSVVVISDGYKRALEVAFRALLKGEIQLNLVETLALVKEAYRSEQKLKSFLTSSRVSVIIGESKRNLLRSIHAIADADVVIWSSGGFACLVHNCLKKANKATILLNAKSYSKHELAAIDQLIKIRSLT